MPDGQFKLIADYDRDIFVACTVCGWTSETQEAADDFGRVTNLIDARFTADAHICKEPTNA